MKKYFALALALVMMLSLCLPAFAAKSPERPVDDVIISAIDKDGKDVKDEIKLEINDESRKAEAELTNDKIKEILGDDYTDKMVLGNVYDVIYSGSAYPVELTVKRSVAKDDVLFVLTKVDGEWVALDGVVVEDGKVTFSITEDSVLAFVYERKIDDPSGPITGNNVAFVAMIALVCLAGTVYCAKRTAA
ncbi:MAG: hypothetical protein IJ519_04165 [Clostridia bacterium]|nr:hypothetical protein [Clostridia bacterium]